MGTMTALGDEQIAWMKSNLARVSHSTPVGGEFRVTLRSASGTDRGNGAAKHSDIGCPPVVDPVNGQVHYCSLVERSRCPSAQVLHLKTSPTFRDHF
jgi:hypothetical protein